MDFKQSNEYMYETYEDISRYNLVGNNKYNYGKEGILNKCLPKVLFKGNNILVSFLQLIDLRMIIILKYIDRLKRFKYISWY